jgi:hypothetical protein
VSYSGSSFKSCVILQHTLHSVARHLILSHFFCYCKLLLDWPPKGIFEKHLIVFHIGITREFKNFFVVT